jgi:hypothetical protein
MNEGSTDTLNRTEFCFAIRDGGGGNGIDYKARDRPAMYTRK